MAVCTEIFTCGYVKATKYFNASSQNGTNNMDKKKIYIYFYMNIVYYNLMGFVFSTDRRLFDLLQP
jgi:hypothetical protein